MTADNSPPAIQILDVLQKTHDDAKCALLFDTPWQLLVATILSAQCTDERVNQVTPDLFARFPGPQSIAEAPLEQIEEAIRSTGFFRNKARNLQACAHTLREVYDGRVPRSMEALVKLPGVGRKTANVVRGVAFGIPSMVVDTHVKRVSNRLGWTRETEPTRIEQDLMHLLPKGRWTQTGHVLIFHGRRICKAPTPRCSLCPVLDLCPRRGVTKSR